MTFVNLAWSTVRIVLRGATMVGTPTLDASLVLPPTRGKERRWLRPLAALVMVAASVAASAGCASTEDVDSSSSELNSVRLDPTHSYADRVQIMHLLEQRHPYPASGDRSLWADQRDGILLQTEWQNESGRVLVDDAGAVGGWWANVNYTLNVWQMLILQKRRGEFSDVKVATYDDPRFAPTPEIEADLLDYYDALDATRAKVDAGGVPLDEQVNASQALLRKLWKFHADAIDVALARNDDVLRSSLPDGERDFAHSWGYAIVPILTAANFPTTGGPVETFGSIVLPLELVEPEDYNLLQGSDLPVQTRTGIMAMRLIDVFEQTTHGKLRQLVERLARTADGAVKAQALIRAALASDNPVAVLLSVLNPFDDG